MWWLLLVALTAAFIALSYRFNPRFALGLVIAIAFTLPAWCQYDVLGSTNDQKLALGLSLKVSVGTTCLLLYCVMPGRTFPVRLVPCDLVMILLVLVHVSSDLLHDGFTLFLLPRIYSEWYVAYVTGRLVVQKREDIPNFWPVVAVLGIIISCFAVIEAFSYTNLYELVFGPRPLEGVPRDIVRWGIKRAYGHSMHPLYLSVVMISLIGWSYFGVFQAIYKRANRFWLLAPLAPILGVIVTGARGSILVIPIAALATIFFAYSRSRWWIFGTVMVIAGFILFNRESILVKLEEWGGERRGYGYMKNQINVDGEVLSHSGTRNRFNLFAVYDIALKRSGLLGFGTENVADFPPNVPLGPRDVATLKKVKFIDNQYILMTLRFGYLGFACLAGAILTAIAQLFYVGNKHSGHTVQRFCACLAGGLVGTAICLLTVWMPHEIGFPLLWTLGMSSGILLAHINGELSFSMNDSKLRSSKS